MEIFGWHFGRKPKPEILEVVKKEFVTTERVILGSPAPVTLYRASDTAGLDARRWIESSNRSAQEHWSIMRSYSYEPRPEPKPLPDLKPWHNRLFYSCEQAFAECPGAQVDSFGAWQVGDEFVSGLTATPLGAVQPKPKVRA